MTDMENEKEEGAEEFQRIKNKLVAEILEIIQKDPDFRPFIVCSAMSSLIASICRCEDISFDKYYETVVKSAKLHKFIWEKE